MTLVRLVSFGYRHPGGIPPGAGPVVDLRNRLRNPPEDPEVRERMIQATGLDPHVAAYVRHTPGARDVADEITNQAQRLAADSPDPASVLVRVGCSGGRHRAPALAVWAAELLTEQGIPCSVTHRDIRKGVIQ